MRWLVLLLFGYLAAAAAPANAGGPVVAELFTSQGCSSCPPADRLLARLRSSQPDLLVLDFHVDYWDRLGWRDPFSLAAATNRQELYATLLRGEVYTPQLVVGGRHAVVGSDPDAVDAALATARAEGRTSASPALRLSRANGQLEVTLGAAENSGLVILVGFDGQHTTQIGRGENSGRTLTEVNVVRSMQAIGNWSGAAARFEAAMPEGEHAAVLVQRADGGIVAAAVL